MRVKIVMNSGEEFYTEGPADVVVSSFKNQLGVLVNGLVQIGNGLYINPSNICSVKEVE